MQKLLVYQSLWAMERRRPDGLEWSLQEKLEMIRAAGFDGAGVRFFDYNYAKEVTGFLRAHGMTWQAQCYPKSVDDLKPIIAHVQELGADHINLQPDVKPYRLEDCIPYIEGWRRLAHDAQHPGAHRDAPGPHDDGLVLHVASARLFPGPAPDGRHFALRGGARVRLADFR